MSVRLGSILENILKALEQLFFKVYFWLGQWVVYFGIVVSAVLALEVLSTSQPEFYVLTNIIGAASALFSVLVAATVHLAIGAIFLLFGNPQVVQEAFTLIWMGGYVFVGHFVAMGIDVIFQPLFTILNILNIVAGFILVDDATITVATEAGPNRIAPATCIVHTYQGEEYLFPKYTLGDIEILGPVLDSVIGALEASVSICLEDIGLGALQSSAEFLGLSGCGSLAAKDLPGLTQAYDGLVWVRDQPLFPADVFLFAFGAIDSFLSFLFPEISGTDILRHYLFINRLEFDSNGNLLPGQGSDPFRTLLKDKIEGVFGCQFANTVER